MSTRLRSYRLRALEKRAWELAFLAVSFAVLTLGYWDDLSAIDRGELETSVLYGDIAAIYDLGGAAGTRAALVIATVLFAGGAIRNFRARRELITSMGAAAYRQHAKEERQALRGINFVQDDDDRIPRRTIVLAIIGAVAVIAFIGAVNFGWFAPK